MFFNFLDQLVNRRGSGEPLRAPSIHTLVLARYRINILDVALPKASPEPKHWFHQKRKIYF